MGTRHLTIVFLEGEYKLAQYGQWDGYPEGAGLQVLSFLRGEMKRDDFIKTLKACHYPSDEQIHKWYKELGADDSGFVSMDVSGKFKSLHPTLNRDMGADILSYIQDHPEGVELRKDIGFAGCSLFCEWAYVIDFDANTFEVFKGFNKVPLEYGERFFNVPKDDPNYEQVKVFCSWPLSELPTIEGFEQSCDQNQEDDEAS